MVWHQGGASIQLDMTSQDKSSKERSTGSSAGSGPGTAIPSVGERDADPPVVAATLHARLGESLRRRIVSGEWPVHHRLPSEAELGASFGVSRITVRKALADLAAQSLIVRVQGKGSFVAPARVRQELDRLQGLAESLGPDGRQVVTEVLDCSPGRLSGEAAAALGLREGAACLTLNTLRRTDGRPLSINRTALLPAFGRRLRREELARHDLLTLYETRLGLRVDRAVVSIGAEAAAPDQAHALGLRRASPVLRVTRAVFASDGRALHYEVAVHRADAFSFRLELAR